VTGVKYIRDWSQGIESKALEKKKEGPCSWVVTPKKIASKKEMH
jgi:hypothetical protein